MTSTLRRVSIDLANLDLTPLHHTNPKSRRCSVDSATIASLGSSDLFAISSHDDESYIDLKHQHAADLHVQLIETLLLHGDSPVRVNGVELTVLECCAIALIQLVCLAQKAKHRQAQPKVVAETDELIASNGFVYLRDFDPTIVENLRYFTHENFVGTSLNGYKCSRSVFTRQAAQALSNAQKDLLADGFSLVVYDTYRPQRAVDHIISWSHDHADEKNRAKYYPDIEKSEILSLGYVHTCSGHTRGSTVDLTIMRTSSSIKCPVEKTRRQLVNGSWVPFLDDGTVDMGTSFDFFGPASNHDSELVGSEYQAMRNYLRDVMARHGFQHLPEEWWHYTLVDEPHPDTYFDFVVEH